MSTDNYKIIVGNATDVGKVRHYNEDYMAHFDTMYGYCVIVCDGMGGHAAGDVASKAAVEAIKNYLRDGKITKTDIPNALWNSIEFANFRLREMVKENRALAGMGTTCVIALIKDDKMYTAHAGDSRLYFVRDGEIRQLSKDHSTVQNLIDAGVMSQEEAQQSEKRNQITKAIGIFEKVGASVTLEPIQLKKDDKILLCSDGLTAHVTMEDIFNVITSVSDVQQAALLLTSKANDGGGTDNITVQLIHFLGRTSSTSKLRGIGRIFLVLTPF